MKTIVNGVTTFYVGNHYEVKNSVVTKYYFAGSTRLAVRTNGTLKYLLADHLGSTTLSTDANGTVSASALYKAFGELRSTPSALGTDYKFTGQREEASLGLYFFVARWFDPSLGRFTSPDTIVPTSTQGTQAWDRYAFVNNNPVRYNDPTGHQAIGDGSQQRSSSSDPCRQYGYDSPECRASLNLPLQVTKGGYNACKTTTCEAKMGSLKALLSLLIPSHVGWNLQASGAVGLPIGFGVGLDASTSLVYYRDSDQLIFSVDAGPIAGVGAKVPVPVEGAITTGPIFGWGASSPNGGDYSIAGGGSISYEGAIAGSISVPMNAPSEQGLITPYIDPVSGQVPVTTYLGVGGGCCGAGITMGPSFNIVQADLSFLLPWNW